MGLVVELAAAAADASSNSIACPLCFDCLCVVDGDNCNNQTISCAGCPKQWCTGCEKEKRMYADQPTFSPHTHVSASGSPHTDGCIGKTVGRPSHRPRIGSPGGGAKFLNPRKRKRR